MSSSSNPNVILIPSKKRRIKVAKAYVTGDTTRIETEFGRRIYVIRSGSECERLWMNIRGEFCIFVTNNTRPYAVVSQAYISMYYRDKYRSTPIEICRNLDHPRVRYPYERWDKDYHSLLDEIMKLRKLDVWANEIHFLGEDKNPKIDSDFVDRITEAVADVLTVVPYDYLKTHCEFIRSLIKDPWWSYYLDLRWAIRNKIYWDFW